MKNTKRILILAVCIAVLVACVLSVTATAAPLNRFYAGLGQHAISDTEYIADYITSPVYRNDHFENQTSAPSYFSGTYISAERSSNSGGANTRVGAKNVYGLTDGNNGFLVFNYGQKQNAKKVASAPARVYNTAVFSSLDDPNNTPVNGYVIEFDFAVLSYIDDMGNDDPSDDVRRWDFPGWLNEEGVSQDGSMIIEMLSTGTATSTNAAGERLYMGVLTINEDKETAEEDFYFNLASGNGRSKNIAADEWVHVTWVFNSEERTFAMYLGDDSTGRELVGYHNLVEGLYPVNFRIGGNCNYGQMAFDNFLSYMGSKVHNPLYIESMSDSERFIYLSGCALDEEIDAYSRYIAYSNANQILQNSSEVKQSNSQDVLDAKAIFNKLAESEEELENLVRKAKLANSEKLYGMVMSVRAIERNLVNITLRKDHLNSITTFQKRNAGAFDEDSDAYKTAIRELRVLETEISQDEAATDFIMYMERFTACKDLGFISAMRNHYEKAQEKRNEIIDPSNYVDENPSDINSVYKKYVKAYQDYAASGELLDGVEKRNTAAKFTEIVNVLLERKNEWFTDDGVCRRLWRSAYQILLDNHYDGTTTVGFEEAYNEFTKNGGIHQAFWAVVQQEHIDYLTEKLNQFNAEGVNYITRYSVIVTTDNYIKQNEALIDPTNDRVAELYATITDFKRNLPGYEEDYANQLLENSEKFVNLVAVLKQKKNYQDIMEEYNNALDCYYSMDIPDDETMAAVVWFEELVSKVQAIERDCEIFKAVASGINAVESKDAIYAELIKGFVCLENLDETVKGVTEAIAAYNAVYDAYMSGISICNKEISAATDIVSSVRAYCGIDELVDFVSTVIE